MAFNSSDPGYSLETIRLKGALARAIEHGRPGCRGRTVAVTHDKFSNGLIIGVACTSCAMPQHCAAPTAGGRHGRAATVLTPAGWRCFECAHQDGYWSEERYGFVNLLCGW
jgi:hypothetical protein